MEGEREERTGQDRAALSSGVDRKGEDGSQSRQ